MLRSCREPAAPVIATYCKRGAAVVFSAGRGIFGRPSLPAAIRTTIEEAFAAAFADPAWAERLH